MYSRLHWLFLVVYLANSVFAEEENYVITLTQKDFDDVISSHPVILVEFYAPWCGHCKRLAPEYEEAAKELASRDPPVPLAKVDATEELELAQKYGVQGYPTLIVFHNGSPYEYEGPRTARGIVKYMDLEASPRWKPPADHVVVLTAGNFTEVVTNADISLVMFYTQECDTCKRFAPVFQKAASDLHVHNIPLAKVDVTTDSELASEYGVTKHPTLQMFRRGKPYKYDGPRQREGIVRYMMEEAAPPSKELRSNRDVLEFKKYNRDPVILALPTSNSDPIFSLYTDVANQGRKGPLRFGHSFDPQIAEWLDLKQGTVNILVPEMFQSKYEPAVVTVNLEGSASEAMDSLLETARPLVGLRDRSNMERYQNYPMLVAYLEIDTTKEGRKSFAYWRTKLLSIASKNRGKLVVAMSPEDAFQQELQELGLAEWGEDVAVGLWAGPRERYAMKDELGENELRRFVKAYYNGDLEPVLRSQPRPRRSEGPVTVVVASTFKQVVHDSKKDVLVMFYTPGCDRCRTLEPQYKELAKKFKKNEKIMIAKFDASENDVPPKFQSSEYPSIFLVPAGRNSRPIRYEGELEMKDIVKFLKRKASSLGKRRKDEL